MKRKRILMHAAIDTFICVMAFLFLPVSASAQLTPEDLAALQQQGEAEGWTFTVGENPATAVPLEDLCGMVVPEGFDPSLQAIEVPISGELPSSFDWRNLGGCTPVKRQVCGNCWAFTTVGVLESQIKIFDNVTTDLSEQHLTS